MSRGPRDESRPADMVNNDEIKADIEGKDPAAVALGRKGGQARAKGLSKERRREIAQKAARTRWSD